MRRKASEQLSVYQWRLIGALLKRNHSLNDALALLKNSYPDNGELNRMMEGLANGRTVKDLLSGNAFTDQLMFFLDYLPLERCISLAIAQNERKRKIKKDLLSRNGYQLVLLAASLILLHVFTSLVIPAMMVNLEISTTRSTTVMALFRLLNTLKWAITASVMLAVITLFIIRKTHREVYVWMYFSRKGHDRLIRMWVTYEFSMRLQMMLQQGISMTDAVSIIRFSRDNPMIALLAHHFDMQLLEGKGLEQSLDLRYFDSDFHSLCLYGLRNSDFVQGLQDYLEFTEMKISRLIKRTASIIQGFCYGFVFAVIILAYQVLLLPLEMLQEY